MVRPPAPHVLVLVALLAFSGCSPADQSLQRGHRTFATVAWDTSFTIGGQNQDTLLLKPRLLAAREDRFYVYDYADFRLKAFDRGGALLWRFGKKGEGPGEFTNPVDIEVAPNGSIWVMDGGASRLTVVSREGHLTRTIPLRVQPARDIVPLRDDLIVTPISPENAAWVALSRDGNMTARGAFPLKELEEAYFPLRGTVAAVSADGHMWAAVFPFGDRLLIYKGRELQCHGRLVEGQPLSPQPPPQRTSPPTVWATAAFFAQGTLGVLARGQSEDALRIVDEYSSADCSYIRTIRLPVKAVAAASSGLLYIIAYENPAPGIMGISPLIRD